MSDTLRATGWRWVPTRAGDTLHAIAYRELGTAARWADLAALNDLLPPYLTADPAVAEAAGGRVLLHGQAIRVFAASAQADAATTPGDLYGADLATDAQGMLRAAAGDFTTVSGLANLSGALRRRVTTRRGELPFHPDYGTTIREIVGGANTPARALLAAQAARRAVEADPRIQRVSQAVAQPDGDRLAITVTAHPISAGTPITVQAEV